MTLILQGTDNSVSSPAVQGGTAGTTTGVYYPTTNQVALATNGTLALIVDASQNIGVGVTPSTNSIGKSIDWVGGAGVFGYSNTMYQSANAYFSGGAWKYKATASAGMKETQNSHKMFSAASGSADATITFTQVFDVSKDTSLALQGATSVSGTGISFPATQSASSDANTLDDYEEGTFTPSIVAGSGTVGAYGTRLGYYTKVGRLVYTTCQITSFSKGTLSGTLSIAGLPFAVAVSANATGTLRYELPSPTAGTTVMLPQTGDGNTIVDVQQFTNSGFNGGYPSANLSASTSNNIYNMVFIYQTS